MNMPFIQFKLTYAFRMSEVLGIMFNVYQIYLFIEFIYNTLDSTVYTYQGYVFQQIVNTTKGKIYYF